VIDGGLSRHFQSHLPLWDWQRVENSGVGRGVPDLNGCYNGTEVWIENKTTEGWAVGVRPEQSAWAARRHRAGGRVFFAVRRNCTAGPRRPAADELYLFGALQGQDLITQSLKTVTPIGKWTGRPAAWDWKAIQRILLGEPPAPPSTTIQTVKALLKI
jgi:hypothetical protein